MGTLYYNVFMSAEANIIHFGKRLKEARTACGYTQEQLADITGISRRMIVHYESHAKKPDIEKIRKIARSLNVSADYLLSVAVPNPKKKRDDLPFKIMKKVRVIEKLPLKDQNAIFQFINSLVEKNKFREELSKK